MAMCFQLLPGPHFSSQSETWVPAGASYRIGPRDSIVPAVKVCKRTGSKAQLTGKLSLHQGNLPPLHQIDFSPPEQVHSCNPLTFHTYNGERPLCALFSYI